MDSEFMDTVAALLGQYGIGVIRFEFPYMHQRRESGKRRPPDRETVLLDSWRQVIAECRGREKLFIGGKSMGGRMASMIADEQSVAGLICLGYPFHPANKPQRLRTQHLRQLKTPGLILQGSRDALGSREQVQDYELSPALEIVWLEDGDHDFKPRRKSGFTHRQHLETAAAAIAAFMCK